MLKITAAVFSGRPNPVWFVGDDGESRAALSSLASERHLVLPEAPLEAGRGFPGFQIELLDDDAGHRYDLPPTFFVALEHLSRHARNNEFVERLLGLLDRGILITQEQSAGTASHEA